MQHILQRPNKAAMIHTSLLSIGVYFTTLAEQFPALSHVRSHLCCQTEAFYPLHGNTTRSSRTTAIHPFKSCRGLAARRIQHMADAIENSLVTSAFF